MIIDRNEGKHLLLRRPDEQDLDFVWMASQDHDFQINCLPDIVEGITRDNIRETLIAFQSQDIKAVSRFFFIIEHRSHGPIGVAILADYTPVHRRCEQIVVIPFRSNQGKGYAIEADLLLLELAFNYYAISKIYGYAYDYNPIGHHLAIRCGFSNEGELRQHVYLTRFQRYGNLYVHGLLETEFRNSTYLAKLSRKLLGRDITRIFDYA